VTGILCEQVGTACVILGGGRERKEDSVDPAVGIEVHKKIGDRVSAGEALCTMHCHSDHGHADAQAARARKLLEESYQIGAAAPVHKTSLVHRVIYKGEH
jgi:thymidine phosphorylase